MRTATRRQQRSTRLRHVATTVHLDERSILSLEFLRRWYSEILNEEPSSSQIIRRALDVLCDQVDRGPSQGSAVSRSQGKLGSSGTRSERGTCRPAASPVSRR